MSSHSTEAVALANLNLLASVIEQLGNKGILSNADMKQVLDRVRANTAGNAQSAEIMAVLGSLYPNG